MTPNERAVLESLYAFAWADGQLELAEESVIEGLLSAFGASDAEEAELKAFGAERRGLEHIPLASLDAFDRELLLSNAALLTIADGTRSVEESVLLTELVALLGFDAAAAERIIAEAQRDDL